MNIPFYIAKRYFSSKKKKKNVVHIISLISLIGICIGTMALVIVLSVYNGFGKVIEELTNVFDSELLIEAKEGKTFHLNDFPVEEISKLDGVAVFSSSVEENAWLMYRKKEAIVTLKGVSDNYHLLNGIDTMMRAGEYLLNDEANDFAILGYGIFYDLGISLRDINHRIRVNIPKRKKSLSLNLTENFNSGYLFPMGTFQIFDQPDHEYVLTNIDFARRLLNYADDEVTSVEIGLTKNANTKKIQKKIKTLVGENFTVKNRHEQQELYHKVYRSEKVMIYIILLFIIFIATFNLIGSIYLLMIDKKKDIAILKSMGMTFKDVRRIFFFEGIIISSVGTLIGVVIGILICAIQQFFKVIKVEGFVMDSFPVSIQFADIFTVILLVLFISTLSVGLTVSRMKDN
ncbi:FtsX-like permease family protein [Bacteroidales bacterium OttesenSCG-928-C19]|nr:FtsX-like permease family protein [Bacteroidales bacterium OttesenSCG-928-C19]